MRATAADAQHIIFFHRSIVHVIWLVLYRRKSQGRSYIYSKTAYAGCARFFGSSAAYSAAGFGRRMALNGYPPSINVCWSKVYIELLYMYTAAAHMCLSLIHI